MQERELEAVHAKIRAAEAEYEKEAERMKRRKLAQKLEELGGGASAVAQKAPQLEVRLADAQPEAARLRATNADLQKDVEAMIALKLKLAEAEATLAELGATSDRAEEPARSRWRARARASRRPLRWSECAVKQNLEISAQKHVTHSLRGTG